MSLTRKCELGYCDRLRAKVQSLETEVDRKTALLRKINSELEGSPHKFVKDLKEEVEHELDLSTRREKISNKDVS